MKIQSDNICLHGDAAVRGLGVRTNSVAWTNSSATSRSILGMLTSRRALRKKLLPSRFSLSSASTEISGGSLIFFCVAANSIAPIKQADQAALNMSSAAGWGWGIFISRKPSLLWALPFGQLTLWVFPMKRTLVVME